MIVLIMVGGTLFTRRVFYLFLWLVNPERWPPAGVTLPSLEWPRNGLS